MKNVRVRGISKNGRNATAFKHALNIGIYFDYDIGNPKSFKSRPNRAAHTSKSTQ
jgi:hypothetical protein